MFELILFRHSRERGNPGIPYLAGPDSRSPIGVEDKLRGSDGLGDFLRDYQSSVQKHYTRSISGDQETVVHFQDLILFNTLSALKMARRHLLT